MEPVDRSDIESRLEAAASAGDLDRLVDLVVGSWAALVDRSPDALLAVLDQLPDGVGPPKLRLARDYIARSLHLDDHSAVYRNTQSDLVPVDVVDRLAILTSRIAAARSAGRAEETIELVGTAHALLRQQPVARGPELAGALPDLHYQWGLALERAGDLDGALDDYTESHEWAVSTGHRMMQTAASGAIAYLHALHGRILTASRWLAKHPPADAGDWWDSPVAMQARLAASLVRSSKLDRAAPDPLRGVRSDEAAKHWAPYFFARALSLTTARDARLLRIEVDTFLATLPAPQRADRIGADYVDLTRLLIDTHAHRLQSLDFGDPATTASPPLHQLAGAARALRQARSRRPRQALQLAEPLLRVDRSRPRVLVPAMLAAALSGPAGPVRDGVIHEAAVIGHAHGYYAAFLALPGESRLRAAGILAELGADSAAETLRAPAGLDLAQALTGRERAVVEHAVAGESVAEISMHLHVSVNTVKSQLRSVYRKLGVTSRGELLQTLHGLRPS